MSTIDELRENVEASLAQHKKWGTWDAYLYNAGTGIVLLFSGVATYLPSSGHAIGDWVPPILTGFVTFWVALDRALTFGPRWKFHLAQSSGYRAVLDQLTFYSTLPEGDQPAHLKKIVLQLQSIRSQESGIPGIDVDGER